MDRDSVYRCEGLGSIAEQSAGPAPQTQFGRALAPVGVALSLAHSPHAKGRVERMHGVRQARLVKALGLAGINDLARANAHLAQTYLPEHNRQFRYEPASATDAPRAGPRNLEAVWSWEVERVGQRDWPVASGGKRYQLAKQPEARSLAGKKVLVRTLRNGREQLERGGVKLRWKERTQRPVRAQAKPVVAPVQAVAERKPAATHPGRHQRIGSARKRALSQRGPCLAVEDSGRPALRSGLPTSPTARHGAKKQTTTPRDIVA